MKRNLLLLTAVVLAAVMLSGCVVWPFGVTVNYELEDGAFAKHDGPKRVKKESLLEVNFTYEKETEVELDKLVVAVTAGKVEFEIGEDFEVKPLVEGEGEEATTLGMTVSIPNVGKENFTISIKVQEDPR